MSALSILVKIVIKEDDYGITEQQPPSRQQRAERAVFYEFCTPLLASGECEVDIGLLHNVLDFLFAELLKLQTQIEKLRGTQSGNVQASRRDKADGHDVEEESTPRMQRELKALVETQHNFENTILILLSRKMETDKQHFKMRDLLRKAKESQFHKVELYLHREAGDHAAVIDSYLADDDLRVQVFEYINNLFYDIRHKYEVAQNAEHSNKDQFVVAPHPSNRLMASNKMGRIPRPDLSVIKIVLERLHKLVLIDAEQCGDVIFTWFPDPDRGGHGDREDNRFFQNAVNAHNSASISTKDTVSFDETDCTLNALVAVQAAEHGEFEDGRCFRGSAAALSESRAIIELDAGTRSQSEQFGKVAVASTLYV